MTDLGGVRPDDRVTAHARVGSIADSMHIEHAARFDRHLYEVRDGVWCLVGNGLSNQSFIRGPEGLIAIDTGESMEEMRSALTELRTVTDIPVVAVLYTHFHYVGGTRELTASEPIGSIHGHSRIAHNMGRTGGEIAPAYSRGLVEQFGIMMPVDGPDALIGVGLGHSYRNEQHAPHTPGHVPCTHTFDGKCTIHIAGLEIHVQPAPSDADDSVTFWFPALGVAVHNLLWPTLFNVFAIRGEEYRDPRILLAGLDHLRSLGAEHLLATHGPPMSGAAEIARRATAYRDSIQFLWDQTVRWTNKGATGPELAHRVKYPVNFGDDWITQQHYGLVEHHVRQIRGGLFGFFDGDPANLLPLEPTTRADRFVAAFGGPDVVLAQCQSSMAHDDGTTDGLRWALELASLLARRTDATAADRGALADVLRTVARRTSAANIRNWCITRARDLDGSAPLDRLRTHRLGRQVSGWPLERAVGILRVMIDPDVLDDTDVHVAFDLDGERCGLHFRHHVACLTTGDHPDATVLGRRIALDRVLSGTSHFDDELRAGELRIDGDERRCRHALSSIELAGFPVGGHS